MASKTDIANRALSKLGEKRVSNIDTQDTDSAKVIRYMWEVVRDAEIAKYPWNFAVKRLQIAKDAAAPVWEWSNYYTLPPDFLSLLEVKGEPSYEIEQNSDGGLAIATNNGSPIFIRYIARVENTGAFDPLFVEALACKIAMEACEEITQSNTKKQLLTQEYLRAISEAYASDSIQEYPKSLRDDEWLLVRSSGYYDDIDYNA